MSNPFSHLAPGSKRQYTKEKTEKEHKGGGKMKNPGGLVMAFLCAMLALGAILWAALAPAAPPAAPEALAFTPEPSAALAPTPAPSPTPAPRVTLAFTGDVNFADDWYNMRHYAKTGGVEDCFSADLLELMRGADILLCNNEFAFSLRGSPLPGKAYAFRADPAHAGIWQQLGADIVSLANNHCFDYGSEAFCDTLDTLSAAEIAYVGAGRDLEEAMTPRFFAVQGLTIGYIACTRAEKYIYTPEAGPDSPGVLRCYDPELTEQAIRAAREECDYLVVYVHWGTEHSTVLEQAQTDLATRFSQAGADLVVGAHPHVLQGAGWRGETPVLYSLGNFWFNMETQDTALLTVTLTGPGAQSAEVRLWPCVQTGGRTSLVTDAAERARVLKSLNDVCESGFFDEDGILHPPEGQG